LIPKLHQNYNFLILTEHLPKSESFPPNLDQDTGPDIRIRHNSGIVLTAPPFNLKTLKEQITALDRSLIRDAFYEQEDAKLL
jgi:hypothetical protein